MTDKVGTKIDKKTQAGKDVYKTPKGEMVSEKSTTFKYKDKWINVPSIHKGHRYDDETLMLMLEAGIISPTSVHKNKKEAEQAARKRSDNLNFNQGGTLMMEQQLDLFERGGLEDEGGQIDEVSGNKVPIGGTKKGVRDDIPAMISEGEFVFPEDVTRYIGLDKLMQLRQEAKMGLKRMEAMGQMGNNDEATMPDDLPFTMTDLIIVDSDVDEKVEMNKGGVIYAQEGTVAPPFSSVRALTPAIERPDNKPINFRGIAGAAYYQVKQYINKEGNIITVGFVGDAPVYPIPDGYTLYDPDPVEGEEAEGDETTKEVNDVLRIVDPKDPKRDRDIKNEFTRKGSWEGVSLDDYIKEAKKFTNGNSSIATGVGFSISGPFGGVLYGAIANEKRKILATIDARISNATGAQLEELKRIKGILDGTIKQEGNIISKITNYIGGLFAPQEIKEQANNVATGVENNLSPEVVEQTTSALPTAIPIDPRLGDLKSLIPAPASPTPSVDIFTDFPPAPAVQRLDTLQPPVNPLETSYPSTPTPSVDIFTDFPPVPVNPTTLPSQPFIDGPIQTEGLTSSQIQKIALDALGPDARERIEAGNIAASTAALQEANEIAKQNKLKRENLTRTTGTGTLPPSPRIGFESGQDARSMLPRYMQDVAKGTQEIYAGPARPVTVTAQTTSPTQPFTQPISGPKADELARQQTPRTTTISQEPKFSDPIQPYGYDFKDYYAPPPIEQRPKISPFLERPEIPTPDFARGKGRGGGTLTGPIGSSTPMLGSSFRRSMPKFQGEGVDPRGLNVRGAGPVSRQTEEVFSRGFDPIAQGLTAPLAARATPFTQQPISGPKADELARQQEILAPQVRTEAEAQKIIDQIEEEVVQGSPAQSEGSQREQRVVSKNETDLLKKLEDKYGDRVVTADDPISKLFGNPNEGRPLKDVALEGMANIAGVSVQEYKDMSNYERAERLQRHSQGRGAQLNESIRQAGLTIKQFREMSEVEKNEIMKTNPSLRQNFSRHPSSRGHDFEATENNKEEETEQEIKKGGLVSRKK